MSENNLTRIATAEDAPGDRRASQPTPPLQRRSVQQTVVVGIVLSVAVILWSGRATFWQEASRNLVRPDVLLQIDLNRASDRELALLPGIGPVLAERILNDRRRNGNFTSLEDLGRVHGIGPKTIDQIAVYCLPVGSTDAVVALAGD